MPKLSDRFRSPAGSVSQRLAFHLQLHLRILLEHLGVTLSEQLRHPLVRDAAGAEPGGPSNAMALLQKTRPPATARQTFPLCSTTGFRCRLVGLSDSLIETF